MWYSYQRAPLVTELAADASREAKRRERLGEHLEPIQASGRAVSTTPWGRAWCDNLISYSGLINRFERGRKYLRHGAVIDLKIAPSEVRAIVVGSSVYDVKITLKPIQPERWRAIQADCAGGISSLVSLLKGEVSPEISTRIARPKDGLFPDFLEVHFSCTCPDYATVCKHVAATVYGVGMRLDDAPELLFTLRQVDPSDLIATATKGVVLTAPPPTGRTLQASDLADLFGVDLDLTPPAPAFDEEQLVRDAYRALEQAKRARPAAIAAALDAPLPLTERLLNRLVAEGLAYKTRAGIYRCEDF